METTERLQRVLAARGIGSRRKAEDLIREGRVKVDGEVVTQLGVRVDPLAARIEVDGRPLRPQPMRYLLLNKPSGYITTTSDERGRRTVLDLVSVPERVYPVGRLDRETDGLLLLTNDGEVANRVMHPRYGLAKEYNIQTTGRPPDRLLERVRRGITVDGKRVMPETFRIMRETHNGVILTMTIHEGMNRVVRKMMDEAGIPVARLRRVRIGPLSLAGIPIGTYRDLSPGELGSLLEALRLQETEPENASGERATRPRSTVSARRQRPRPTTPRESAPRSGRERPAARSTPAAHQPEQSKSPDRTKQRGKPAGRPSGERQSEGARPDRRNERDQSGGRRRKGGSPSVGSPGPRDERRPQRKAPVRNLADEASRSGGSERRKDKPRTPKQRATPKPRKTTAPENESPPRRRNDDDRP